MKIFFVRDTLLKQSAVPRRFRRVSRTKKAVPGKSL